MAWDEVVHENFEDRGRPVRLSVHRQGWCEFAYEFYADGQAFARKFTYHNEDRTQGYDPTPLGIIHNEIARPQRFPSHFSVTPRGHNLYDLAWQSPTIQAPEQWFKETRDAQGKPRRWRDTQRASTQLWNAYCVGNIGNTYVNSMLRGVPPSGELSSPNGAIARRHELQKQVRRARVEIHWRLY